MHNIDPKDYACPICGTIPSPMLYEIGTTYHRLNHSCYLIKDGKLAIPFVKMKPIQCCEGYYVAPYHSNSKEYLEVIRPYFPFFAPIVPWVESILRDELEKST